MFCYFILFLPTGVCYGDIPFDILGISSFSQSLDHLPFCFKLHYTRSLNSTMASQLIFDFIPLSVWIWLHNIYNRPILIAEYTTKMSKSYCTIGKDNSHDASRMSHNFRYLTHSLFKYLPIYFPPFMNQDAKVLFVTC